ncbi:TrkH family potassium uptake protein [Plastorhodobacter daqingensis]|uniref:Trk system potassium uptake protein n=1 Tax=Plastorhodobacter daqingensis TaxID=1387281 RepID=A0ABW2UL36_9RHOB
MFDARPVGYVIGLLVAVLGAAMLLPMLADLLRGDPHWMVFFECAVITGLSGGLIALACSNSLGRGLNIQQSFLLTTGVWIALPAFGALPFMMGVPGASFTDAMFESMSGMTTTGATVFVGLDDMPAGTLLWRGMLQWLGGLGIVIVALIFLPVMKVGGMQFFRSEGFDTLGKILPRALDISSALIQVYVALTVACTIVYYSLGMTGFDALVHALTTIATGGFSTTDASFAAFRGPLEYASTVFMLLATLPFIRYVQVLNGSVTPLWQDLQVRAYLRWAFYAIVAVVLYRSYTQDVPFFVILRETTFNIVTLFSGTGYGSADVTSWGAFSFVVIIIVGMIGGCTSSTGCSIKVFRYLVLLEGIKAQVRRIQSPSRVIPVRLGGRAVGEDVLNSVIVLFTCFILTFGLTAVALSMTGLQTLTALTAAWTAIFNIGPAFGPEVGPTGAVDAFPALAKWLMIFAMLLGRLELLAVFVLFVPRFWRG